MQLTSPAFTSDQVIPQRFTCEGENINPELSWQDAPSETKAFVLIVHDPDAPRAGGYTHWVLYNLPADLDRIPENLPKEPTVPGFGRQGKNDGGKIGYTGPCPPSGWHRYFFRLSALDQEISIAPGATVKEVAEAMAKHVIARAELMGTYAKQSEQATQQHFTVQAQPPQARDERSPERRSDEQAQLDELGTDPGQVGADSAGQSGDMQLLSDAADMSEESVEELAETEQSLESAAVEGSEDAADHPERPVHTHNDYGRPDDVPPKRDRDEAA